jgi:hypothetical protein
MLGPIIVTDGKGVVVADVPLPAIQSGQAHRYSSVCRAGEPVQCEVPEEGG